MITAGYPASPPRLPKCRALWPSLVCWLAGVWSAALAVLGGRWWGGAAGYPFGPEVPTRTSGSGFEGVPVEVGAPVMVVIGAGGAALAVAMAGGRLRRLRSPVLTWGWLSAVVFVAVVPDYTVIAVLAMWPAFVLFAFTGVPGPQGGLGDIIYWHRAFLILVFVGGLLWAGAVVSYQRRVSGRCTDCGRGPTTPTWAEPARTLRWGRRAVWVAVLSCVPYEVTRIAWAMGWPLGITREFHTLMANTPGMLQVGLGLALLSLGGAVLTHGLVARWGEVFPRWIPGLGGRPVPPMLAVVPASLVVAALPPAGLMSASRGISLDSWATNVPGILWFGWAVGLAMATYAYHLRRRSTCRRCGRGEAPRSVGELDTPQAEG